MVRISVGIGWTAFDRLVLERCAAAWLQLCDLALHWNLEASQYNELYCMMGASHDEKRCRPDDPWLQYVYGLALRWELDHMIGN